MGAIQYLLPSLASTAFNVQRLYSASGRHNLCLRPIYVVNAGKAKTGEGEDMTVTGSSWICTDEIKCAGNDATDAMDTAMTEMH
jgi:hypothetical protein